MTIKIGEHLYGDKIFYRVKAKLAGGGTKIFWAQRRWERFKNGIGYVECNKFGQARWSTKKNIDIKHIEIVLAQPEDIIYEKEARMNLHYGELEIIKEDQ